MEGVGCITERLGVDRAVDDLEAVHLFLMIVLNDVFQLVNLIDRVFYGGLLLFGAVEDPVEQVAGAHLQQRSGDAARNEFVDSLAEREAREILGDSLSGGCCRRSGGDACRAYRNDGDQ